MKVGKMPGDSCGYLNRNASEANSPPGSDRLTWVFSVGDSAQDVNCLEPERGRSGIH